MADKKKKKKDDNSVKKKLLKKTLGINIDEDDSKAKGYLQDKKSKKRQLDDIFNY